MTRGNGVNLHTTCNKTIPCLEFMGNLHTTWNNTIPWLEYMGNLSLYIGFGDFSINANNLVYVHKCCFAKLNGSAVDAAS